MTPTVRWFRHGPAVRMVQRPVHYACSGGRAPGRPALSDWRGATRRRRRRFAS